MNKKSFLTVVVVLFIAVALFAFAACSENGGTATTEKKVISLTPQVPDTEFVIGQIDFSTISLIVEYADGEKKTVFLTESMIDSSDLSKVRDGAQPGMRQIRVSYDGFSTKINLKLVLATSSFYTVRVVGGYVSAINGEAIVAPVIPADGESFSDSYEAGTVLTLIWKTVEGRHFDRWTVDNVEIAGESIINVTVNSDVEYRAYSSSVFNTVSFVTGFDDLSVKPKTTNVLNERDIETLEKDGYVFLGWTTDEIDETAARSGYKLNRITFPYGVTRDTTLYGVWTPIGITYRKITGGYAVAAFDGEVAELVIPETYDGEPVIEIYADAFKAPKCEGITKITLPSSLKTVGEGAFAQCTRLTEIAVSTGSENFLSDDGVLFDAEKKKLYSYPAAKVKAVYVVPEETTEIAEKAFFDAAVGGITLGSNVKRIGSRAFDGATISYVDFYDVNPSEINVANYIFNGNVSQICVAESKKSIIEKASYDFTRFADKIVTSRNTLDKIGSYSTVEPDGKKASTVYRVIQNVNFELSGKTAEILTTSRDVNAYTLQIYTQDAFGYTITSLGPSAFARCTDLNEFRIPAGSKLERICDGALDDTPWAENLTSDAIIANEVYYKYLGNAETVKLGSVRIDKIAEGAFSGKIGLKYLDVTDNASLKTIAAYAFYGCVDFRGFKCKRNENGNGLYLKKEVEKIGAYAFYGTAVTGVTIQPEDRTTVHDWKEIGEYAFGKCDLLSFVQMPVGLNAIANTAFVGCTALEKFEIDGENARFEVYDGVLYQKNDDGYTLLCYPSGKICGEFDPSVTTERNYASSITKDETLYIGHNEKTKVGDVYFDGAKTDLFMTVFVEDETKLQSGHDGVILYGERPLRETTEIVNGTPDGEKTFSVIDGSGKERFLLYDAEKENYYYYTTLKVTEFAPYSLKDANIGALIIPEATTEIDSDAIDVKGLTYVLFKSNPTKNYKDIFTKAQPTYVVIPENVMVDANRRKFYNDSVVQAEKDKTSVPYKFFYAYNSDGEYFDDNVLYGLNAENGTVAVVRTSRSAASVTVPEEVYAYKYTDGSVANFVANDKKRVLAYSFFGGKLKEVSLRRIDELCNYAFTEAYEMTKLDLNGDFISKLGSEVFGGKFGNGLFIYDYRNGAELYDSVENWRKGLEFFTYGVSANRKAAKYLISDPKGAFAVIEYLNGEEKVFVELQYEKVTAEELAAIKAAIGKKGYDVTSFERNDGEIVSVFDEYLLEYNQILTCVFTPKEYVVYVYASENVVFDENFEFVSKNETGLVKYETRAVYAENYAFEPLRGGGKYTFYKFYSGDTIIESNGVWTYDFEGEAELLLIIGYKLTLKNGDEDFGEKTVFFGKEFELSVPTGEEGKRFVGWELVTGETKTQITDGNGKSLDVWSETSSDDYVVCAKWE